MRITKKIFALILVVFMVAGSLVSCQKKPDSSRTLYAVYDGSKFIYAADTDFISIFVPAACEGRRHTTIKSASAFFLQVKIGHFRIR